ncbi:MAG: hypothetical protein CMD96_03860 [Gammaproteobacteria bacterium]|jgi:hypothetical protein|nr:hypothetical protein [Gammaproteobacteria bacterium]HJP18997.1 hypothetical protein [Nitrospinota bacterium]|tara:strand:- start:2452 stop:3192 length:741 start_codon:yes stop_codon:yes gene_type:complete
MSNQLEQDSVVLDPQKFISGTRKWDIPILKVPGVQCEELYIEGNQISTTDFSVKKNHLSLSNKHNIKPNTKAYLIVSFNPKNMLIKFWLPIILAIIGIIGSIVQPFMYSQKWLYQPPMDFHTQKWGYDDAKHKFETILLIKNLKKNDIKNMTINIGVREENTSIDPLNARYSFIGGPFELKQMMEMSVSTNKEFTENLEKRNANIEGVIFLTKKGLKVEAGFSPPDYPEGDMKKVGNVAMGPFGED